jgi:hypothetical protein
LTIKPTRGFLSFHRESERRTPLCHKLLRDSRFYELLLQFDADLAAEVRRTGVRCRNCDGPLHKDRFPRKPRGPVGVELPPGYRWRFSYSCATCRARHTPPSTRFLGRRIYLGMIVVLATAMQQGPAPWRMRRLREELGVSQQTLERWRAWWREAFVESAFWKAARAAFSPPVADAGAPRSLLERFGGEEVERLAALVRFLAPLSTPAEYVPDRRQ